MRLPLKTCLTFILIMSTTSVGCSLWGCQPPLSERSGLTSVTVTIESPPLKAQQNLSEALIKELLSSHEGQALMQRTLIKLYLEGQGVQRSDFKGIPSWKTLIQASSILQQAPSEDQLRKLYQQRYPQGQDLKGVQLTLKASHHWQAQDWKRYQASLKYWARNTLSQARQDLLQGSSIQTVQEKLQLTTLKGQTLSKQLKSLRSPHLNGTLKRLRAGEFSPVIEHQDSVCLYHVEVTPNVLKENLPRAVTELTSRFKTQLNTHTQQTEPALKHQGILLALCLNLSLEGLKTSTGRSFDQWLRNRVISLKELGALNQNTLDAFALTPEPLQPQQWPPQLQEQLAQAQPSVMPNETWYQAEATDHLWFVALHQRTAISFENAKSDLKELFYKRQTEEDHLQLLIEQSWEELSPRLLLQAPGSAQEELDLSEPNLNDDSR